MQRVHYLISSLASWVAASGAQPSAMHASTMSARLFICSSSARNALGRSRSSWNSLLNNILNRFCTALPSHHSSSHQPSCGLLHAECCARSVLCMDVCPIHDELQADMHIRVCSLCVHSVFTPDVMSEEVSKFGHMHEAAVQCLI